MSEPPHLVINYQEFWSQYIEDRKKRNIGSKWWWDEVARRQARGVKRKMHKYNLSEYYEGVHVK